MADYFIGQKMIHVGKMAGKPAIAYIVGDPYGYLIRMSEHLDGRNPFFIHRAKIEKEWKDAKKQSKKGRNSPSKLVGKQVSMFPKEKTVREIWREKNIINHP